MAAGEPVSSIAAIQKTASLRYDDPRVVHVIDNSRPDAYRLRRGSGQRRPLRRGELAARVRPLSRRLGQTHLGLRAQCRKPIVTTFHTLLTQPDPLPRRLIQNLAAHSQGIVVMTKVAAELLASVYGVSGPNVQVIPHGVPDGSFSSRRRAQGPAGARGPAGHLHLRTHQSRQGAGVHDPGHAADRCRLSRTPST